MLPALLLLLATREIFPADYTPSPCAVQDSCVSFPDSSMKSAAFQFLGLELDPTWAAKHGPEVKAALAPLCRKHATCQTYPTNSYTFCDDVLAVEARPVCAKMFPNDEQCKAWVEIYLMGVDQNAINSWKAAQACAKKQPPATHAKQLDVWMSPESVPYEYKGAVTFYATDPDTHVPVLARVTFEDQVIYAEANPTGESATYYPMKLPFKYVRVPNKDGHTDAAAPLVTVKASGYPVTTFRLPAVLPGLVVEMKPAGKDEVMVTAKDKITGKNVDGRVMLGRDEIGFTDQPIAIKRAKSQELWFKPYLNRYSDVVLVPAAK